MIIVSQDKQHILNFENTKEIRINNYNCLMADIYSDYELQLGNYKTKERANKTYINSIQSIAPVLLEDYIEKEKIKEKIEERQFELQQEYKDFKDDIKLNTLQKLLERK